LHYRKSVVGITSLRSAMRASAYDVVVDMTDNASSTSSMLVTMSNARYAVGIDKENRGAFTHVVPRVPRDSMHIVDRIVRLLWPFGIDDGQVNKRMEYRITENERTTAMRALKTLAAETATDAAEKVIRVGINISGSDVTRRLDAATTIACIAKIRRKHAMLQRNEAVRLEFYVFTTPDLVGVQHAICSSAAAVAVPVSKSFHAYACALSCMHAIITPDTAAVHLAAAWQMPSVVLYRPEIPAVHPWYPYDSYSVACHTQTNSVANITADEIADAVDVMLRDSGLRSAQLLS
jgi:ADP-heptose:LPS heptosyltransferase